MESQHRLFRKACSFLNSILSKHMVILKVLFFLFFLFPVIYATEDCSISICGNNGSTIRFPFRLEGQQPQNCGYPGFDLSCSPQGITVLKLPYSGEFYVRDISYVTHEIQLYDPDNCLPRRLLHFNVSGSPFMAAHYQNYTILSCPSELTRSRFTAIDCLSNSTNAVLATSSMSLARLMSTSCTIIITLPVPVLWPVPYEDEFSTDLSDDLHLTWITPDCGDCEAQGGTCGFVNYTTQEIGCFYNPGTGSSSQSANGLQVFKIISLSIAIPAMACAIGIVFFICFMDRSHRRAIVTQRNSAPAAVSPQPTIVTMGLDESTIDSYTKLVLGESRRIPGPNHGPCSICLSEYHPEETLRCIPECKHCFHADCIDEWLRMNNTCPVCRNSPSPAHVS